MQIKSRERDLHILMDHHTVRGVGTPWVCVLPKAIGEQERHRRYGHAYVPRDEALSRVGDQTFSGRPGLALEC